MVVVCVKPNVILPSIIPITVGLLLVGCADVTQVHQVDSQRVAVQIDLMRSGSSQMYGPWIIGSAGSKKSLEIMGIGADVTIGAKLIERRKANLMLNVGGESHEFVVTPEWNTLDLLSKKSVELRFRFLSSSIPPFAPTSTISDELTVLSLIANKPSVNEPEKYQGIFRENLVRLKIEAQDEVIAQQLFSVLTTDKATGVQGADCFEPQYGIIAEIDNADVEMLLDFECGWLHIFDGKATLLYGLTPARTRSLRDSLDVVVRLGK